MLWHYVYNETGGYDCMTGAYVIKRGDTIIAVIDQHDFGQESCSYTLTPEAEKFAQFIVDACNEKEKANDEGNIRTRT